MAPRRPVTTPHALTIVICGLIAIALFLRHFVH